MRHVALAIALASLAAPAFARQPNTYQVTGDVLDVADDLIVVQKGKEKFEIARTPDTKMTATPKKGDKATVEYRMSATSVDVKSAGAAASKDAPKEKKAKK